MRLGRRGALPPPHPQLILLEMADFYDEETTYGVDRLTGKLEPLAIVVIMIPIALLVGGGTR